MHHPTANNSNNDSSTDNRHGRLRWSDLGIDKRTTPATYTPPGNMSLTLTHHHRQQTPALRPRRRQRGRHLAGWPTMSLDLQCHWQRFPWTRRHGSGNSLNATVDIAAAPGTASSSRSRHYGAALAHRDLVKHGTVTGADGHHRQQRTQRHSTDPDTGRPGVRPGHRQTDNTLLNHPGATLSLTPSPSPTAGPSDAVGASVPTASRRTDQRHMDPLQPHGQRLIPFRGRPARATASNATVDIAAAGSGNSHRYGRGTALPLPSSTANLVNRPRLDGADVYHRQHRRTTARTRHRHGLPR